MIIHIVPAEDIREALICVTKHCYVQKHVPYYYYYYYYYYHYYYYYCLWC
jgi:hypothetical protein